MRKSIIIKSVISVSLIFTLLACSNDQVTLTSPQVNSPARSPGSATNSPPIVKANGEELQGQYNVDKSLVVFKGIPFAAPPIKALRWQAPEPHIARNGVQLTNKFSPGCFQDSYNTEWYRDVAAEFSEDTESIIDPEFNEDCLYLNIWSPVIKNKEKLPVMVWIHGGSNKAGWSFEYNYQGQNLAKYGKVIVVSLAYRLGVFSFISHPEMAQQTNQTNFGLLDQIQALKWLQANIENFGGDKNNITLFGESAGASNIGFLMTSPLAKDLFHKAISQSGGFQVSNKATIDDAKQAGLTLQKGLSSGQQNLQALKQLTSAELFALAKQQLSDHYYSPVVDGVVLPVTAVEYYKQRKIDVDLLIGFNKNEWYMYEQDDPNKLSQQLSNVDDKYKALISKRLQQEPTAKHRLDVLSSLIDMVCPAYFMAERVNESGHNAFVYRFDKVRDGAGGKALLAYHGAEIPYVFDRHDEWLPTSTEDQKITSAMMTYWTNFAKTGNPNQQGLTDWPAFNFTHKSLMVFNHDIETIAPIDGDLCQQLLADY